MPKYIFVTGGVVSSVGKGITVASIGTILKNRQLSVSVQKLDPYLNVDPGTMSPYQHGEVFVTQDGAETDLDLGNYERFIDAEFTADSNVTSGQIYSAIIAKERKGDFLRNALCRKNGDSGFTRKMLSENLAIFSHSASFKNYFHDTDDLRGIKIRAYIPQSGHLRAGFGGDTDRDGI